ncbi:hypothetical protein XpiCFBP4643_07800 [Xanthomonas pisi]|uniref:Uncharacterized protein n=2 Tax=Xanthomonas TaxID=338 RepID=A0A2S7D573_9XANT|nr:hypothetical protein XpiCFBP4643_07800 [Xanthomonas pisi]
MTANGLFASRNRLAKWECAMYENHQAVPSEVSSQHGRKVWTTPTVAFLAIDETANQTFSGNDGTGTGTGS